MNLDNIKVYTKGMGCELCTLLKERANINTDAEFKSAIESDSWKLGHYKGYYILMPGKKIHMTIEGNIGKYCKRYRGNETLISTSYTRDSIFPG